MASPLRERCKYMILDLYSDDIESLESDPGHMSMRPNPESELQEHGPTMQSESSVSDSHNFLEDADRDEILHLPGNLLRFANWAFGSDGLSSLPILAFSNFSYDNRFQFNNHVFCRQTWSISRPRYK